MYTIPYIILNSWGFKIMFPFTVAKEVQEITRNLDSWFKGTSVFGKVNSWSFGKLKMGSDAIPFQTKLHPSPIIKESYHLLFPLTSPWSSVCFPTDDYSNLKIRINSPWHAESVFILICVFLRRETPVHIPFNLG